MMAEVVSDGASTRLSPAFERLTKAHRLAELEFPQLAAADGTVTFNNTDLGEILQCYADLYEALVEAERAWADAAILVAHTDQHKQRQAKDALYAWRDKAHAILAKARGEAV